MTGVDRSRFEESLRNFVGRNGYDLDVLRNDFARFCFLPGDDGTRRFGTDRP
jgi:hypothetical protein